MKVASIVDSDVYVSNNCYQHQLQIALDRSFDHTNVQLFQLVPGSLVGFDVVVCRLKLRSLRRCLDQVSRCVPKGVRFVVYDQDPWESFRDDSPLNGSYNDIASAIDVSSFCVTTEWWAEYIENKGLPSTFVKMWTLPEYCTFGPATDRRTIDVGFIGSAHPHRKKLFDELRTMGINVYVEGGSYTHKQYLQALERFKIFIHSEDQDIFVDGSKVNLGLGLWVKDIEAAARGCYCIRNASTGSDSYGIKDVETSFLYNDVSEVPTIINDILTRSDVYHMSAVSRAVSYISSIDAWTETAKKLVVG